MSSPEAPPAIASAVSPAAYPPASGVEAVARQPINAHLFSPARIAAAEETARAMRLHPRVLSPSNMPVWRGSRREGERFTGEQIRLMPRFRLDPQTCETILVASPVTLADMPVVYGALKQELIAECPILDQRGSKVRVLTPGGFYQRSWVYFDGSITKVRV